MDCKVTLARGPAMGILKKRPAPLEKTRPGAPIRSLMVCENSEGAKGLDH
jgi:hypothetical protein